MNIKWPEPLTYYYSTRGYPENCVGAANKMLAACKKAVEEAQGHGLVPLDEQELSEFLKQCSDNIKPGEDSCEQIAKMLCERFGSPKAGVESKDLHKQDKRVLGDRLCKLMGWGNKGWDIQNKALKRQMIYELICRIETTPAKGDV